MVDEGGHGHSEVYALAVFRCWPKMEYVLISYSRRYQKRMVLLDQICSLGIQKHLHSWVKKSSKVNDCRSLAMIIMGSITEA